MATAPPRKAGFYESVANSLLAEGLKDRKIIRSFLAHEQEDALEVLLVAHGRHAETIWVDFQGALIHGPIPGFGEGKVA